MAIRWEVNGKTVLLTQAQFNRILDGDDEFLELLVANDDGVFIEDPFENIKVKEFKDITYPEDPIIEDLPDQEIDKIKEQFNGT